MQAKQQGFTLIELIVVIVILGILAATALPKFIDLGSDARRAVVDAVEGSMRSANAMIYAKAAAGNHLSGTTTLSITGISGSIGITNGFATDGTELVKAMDIDSAKISSAAGGLNYNGYAVGTCGVAYSNAGGAGVPPTYTKITTGC